MTDGAQGYVYASPTVVDLNEDGQLEVIIGTAAGMIYVLDSKGMNYIICTRGNWGHWELCRRVGPSQGYNLIILIQRGSSLVQLPEQRAAQMSGKAEK